MNQSLKDVELCVMEDPIYPAEFLSAMKDTAFQAVQDFLNKIDAPKEAQALLEDLAILTTWTGDFEQGAPVRPVANQTLIETVANACRNIVALGGVFYSPSGITIRREIGGEPELDHNHEPG